MSERLRLIVIRAPTTAELGLAFEVVEGEVVDFRLRDIEDARLDVKGLEPGEMVEFGSYTLKLVGSSPNDVAAETVCFPNSPDGLTGALRKRPFVELLEGALLDAEAQPITLLGFRCAELKETNDVGGFLAGDRLLRETAARAMRVLGDERPLGRIGGNRFVALLSNTSRAEGSEIAAALRAELRREPVRFEEGSYRATIAWATVTHARGIAAESLLRAAMEATDVAKSSPSYDRPAPSSGPWGPLSPLGEPLLEEIEAAASSHRRAEGEALPMPRLVPAEALRERGAYREALELVLSAFSTAPYDGRYPEMPPDVALTVFRYEQSPDTVVVLSNWVLSAAGMGRPVRNWVKDDGYMEVTDGGTLPNTTVLAYRGSELIFWDGGPTCRGYDGNMSYDISVNFARRVTDWLCVEIAAVERGIAHLKEPKYGAPRHADDLRALSDIALGALRHRHAVIALERLPAHLVEGNTEDLVDALLEGRAADALLVALTRGYEIARRDAETKRVLDRFPRQELAVCGHALSATLRHTRGALHARTRELHAAWVSLLELRYMSECGGEAARHRWKQGR